MVATLSYLENVFSFYVIILTLVCCFLLKASPLHMHATLLRVKIMLNFSIITYVVFSLSHSLPNNDYCLA